MIVGSKLYYLEEVDSTNDYAKRIAPTAPDGAVVLAEMQTDGKGRQNRKWYSPKGGLYLSVITNPENASLMPILAGVAICETFNNYHILLGLKWPNDVMLNEKKVAGVLIEFIDTRLILGIGINLNITSFPEEIRDRATSIFLETKKKFDKMSIYRTLCLELNQYYTMLNDKKDSTILQKWRNYSVIFGRNVLVELPDRKITGRAIDIANDGSLILMLPEGKVERIFAGECQVIKTQPQW